MTDWGSLVRPSLPGIEPYRPGPSVSELEARYGLDGIVKLNWNEGLFGPLPGVLEAVAAQLDEAWMYPEHAYTDLREAVGRWLGVEPEWIVPAHGIQALLTTIAAAFLTPGERVVIPAPTYGRYAQVSTAAGALVDRVPSSRHRLDLEAVAATARRVGARLVWICDPNNPTGSLVERDEWDAFLSSLPERCAAVVDEAYVEYVSPERRLLRERDVEAGRPLVVLRTFSKIFGLAGLRLGYAIVHGSLAPYLDVVQEPFNVNRAALSAGVASLRAPELIEERRREAAEMRSLLGRLLTEHGIDVVPSEANFVLARLGVDDLRLVDLLARRGVLVRPGRDFGLPGYVRITVGPRPLMERAAAELGRARDDLLAETAAR